jgi:hypothetical protein
VTASGDPVTGHGAEVVGTSLISHKQKFALPKEAEHWSFITLREERIKIGNRVVRHGRDIAVQLAEIAIPRRLFAEILRRVGGLRPKVAEPAGAGLSAVAE